MSKNNKTKPEYKVVQKDRNCGIIRDVINMYEISSLTG